MKRKIIQIAQDLCNGCGNCIISCPEKAIELVDTPQGKKARLVKEFYCDGLGACLGACPTGALTIEEREAEAYDEKATQTRIKALDLPVELHNHHAHQGCPSAQMQYWEEPKTQAKTALASELRQWPIQLHLLPTTAPYLNKADLLLVADCVPLAYGNFHRDFLAGKAIALACPKLDDTSDYVDKLAGIIKESRLKSLKVIHLEVPCCRGLVQLAKAALEKSGKIIPFETVVIGIKGEIKN